MIKLTGKKVLITGGSRGIGKATAIMFAQAGADIAFTYQKNQDQAGKVLDDLFTDSVDSSLFSDYVEYM